MTTSSKPSKIIAVFLVQFDIRKGYELIWSKSSIKNFDFTGLEYKVLPLGVHESEKSTILISHLNEDDKLYYGISRFILRIDGDSSDRSNIHMFSLGILCDPGQQSWKPNEFINCGWEYVDILDDKLEQYLTRKDYQDYQIFENILSSQLLPSNFSPDLSNHLITKLPKLLEMFGPLIFPIFKQSLLRKNILIFNSNNNDSNKAYHIDRNSTIDHNNLDENHNLKKSSENYDSYYTIESFSYLISLISIIPNDINHIDGNYYSQPLYNVGLNDGKLFQDYPGYVASTNDDILMYQTEKYDLGILINNHENNPQIKFDLSDKNQDPILANLKDYNKLKYLVRNFEHQSKLPISDDLRSIHSCMSNYDGSNTIATTTTDFLTTNEPQWWLETATYPMSWREFIWSAFSWFASAGSEIQQSKDTHDICIQSPKNIEFIQLIHIIGYFHNLTRKWFELINSIILEEIEQVGRSSDQLLTKYTIELSYQDIIDMDLDPYDENDLQFVREFILLYWGNSVDEVEIGLGIANICC